MNHLSSAILKHLGYHILNSEKILHIVGYNLPNNTEGIYSWSQTALMLERKTKKERKRNPNIMNIANVTKLW